MHDTIPRSPNQEILGFCSHIFAASATAPAHSCGSPALRGQSFCYYHHPARPHVLSRDERRARVRSHRIARQSITLPIPTTRAELLGSLSKLLSLIAANQIDHRRAGILLRALNAAGKHLP
jgi:hypothetical protein